MRYFNEKLTHIQINISKKLKFFLSEFDTLLMYIKPSDKKSHFSKNKYILQKDNHFQY